MAENSIPETDPATDQAMLDALLWSMAQMPPEDRALMELLLEKVALGQRQENGAVRVSVEEFAAKLHEIEAAS